MSHTRSSLTYRLRRLAFAAAVLALPGLGWAEDIDLYTGAPVNGGSPNLLVLLDNAAAWNGDVSFTCPTTSYVSTNNSGKDAGFEQCALYQFLTTIGTNTQLQGKINMGLMLFDYNSNPTNGGVWRFPNVNKADPGPLKLMDAAGVAAFQTAIKTVDRQNDQAGGSAVGGGMQETWAYFSGGTGLSGVKYKSPLTSPCTKNFVIYIANANKNGKPQDGSSKPNSYTTLAAAMGQTPTQINIPNYSQVSANWGDEWAQFMYQTDLSNSSSTNPQNIITYTIAVTDGSPQSADYVAFLQSMASHGGGKAFIVNVNDPNALNQLIADLTQIFNEVQSINSVFASVSLPVSVNAQGVSLNQVYVGMFRPDPTALPRWVGNIKQYQLGLDSSGNVVTEDSLGNPAISNNGSGFISPNALSFWTADQQTGTPRRGPLDSAGNVVANWPTTGFWIQKPSGVSQAYDAVDGEVVEKGGAGEMLRADYLTAQTGRTVYTCNGVGKCPTTTAPPKFDTSNSYLTATVLGTTSSGDPANLINWVRGTDNTSPNNEVEPGPGGNVTIRPSVHGDVLHSRPATVNYGGSTGVVVYYGSNDGHFHAINGNQTASIGSVRPGGELWSFIAPEFFGKLKRLRDNSPIVKLYGITDTTAKPKDYFFDGTTTVFQDQRTSSARTYIYMTMRRGGRSIYAMDVTTPASPKFLWSTSNADIPELGQTWSQPKVAQVHANTNPVLIMGGGYDTAEDVDPTSGSDTMGRAIVVLDATTGKPVWTAAPSCTGVAGTCLQMSGFTYAIPSDVTMLDRDNDGYVDRLYVGDLGGNIWRVDVNDASASNWTVTKLATLSDATNRRKFFYPPDVVPMATYDAVMAASGDREHPLASNAASSVVNRFYSLRDTNTGMSVTGTWTPITESALVNATSTTYAGTGSGFYVTLQNAGEKAVNAPLTVAGYTYFGTNEPANPTNNPNMCYPNLGIARGYAINFIDGTGLNANRFVQFEGGGMPPSPIFGLVNLPTANGGTLTTPVLIGAGNQLGLVGGNNTSSLGSQKVVPPGTGKRKRTYWYVEGVK